MKSLTCDLCDHVAHGETFEDWMKALMPHYMEAHGAVMKKQGEGKTDAEQKEHKMNWMRDNMARFEAA